MSHTFQIIVSASIVLVIPAASVHATTGGVTDAPTVTYQHPVRSAPVTSQRESIDLNWAGIGVRWGKSQVQLAPRQSNSSEIRPLDHRSTLVTPTLHLGGAGYFFKLEAPMSIGGQNRTVGVGIYPINYGYLFNRTGLFPYLSAGAVTSVVVSGRDEKGLPQRGGFVQLRAAVGLKYRVIGALTLSAEVGYSRWAA
ncbi:MAG: hypothetical protein H7X95_05085, partial [Deltaproteobacteria bacterium]|nr:hypothetical protein [Deltaproteobacteria bacterium]